MDRSKIEAIIRDEKRGGSPPFDAGSNVSTPPNKIALLFVGCNPNDRPTLDLTREFDELETQLESTSFVPRSRWDVPASKLPDLLGEQQPQIIHFSGHGSGSGELLFVGEDRRAYAPDPEALARVFAQHEGRVRCVVLNACFSEPQAERIAKYVDVVIGISNEISDENARSFTREFYRALGRGRSIQQAFEGAKLKLELGPRGLQPGLRLLAGSGPPPSQIVLRPTATAVNSTPAHALPAHRYERTSAWSNSLAPRSNDRDETPRERLRAAFRRMHDNAARIANAIGDDLTIHDLAHLDSLWEAVDLIGSEGSSLTPCEAFVLGSALLAHELGKTEAAYPNGRNELREELRWHDTVAQLMRRNGLDHQPRATPPEHIAKEADRLVLRSLHADRATAIPNHKWTDERGRDVHFIEDAGVRESFADLIGTLASNLWSPIARLRDTFDSTIGPPRWCPPNWTIDPLRVACLVRAVEAAHIGDRWGSTFPSGRMQQPVRHGEQLQFGSSTAFVTDEAPSWWTAVEILRSVDSELRSIDALLQAAGRERLAARRVAAVDDLHALQRHLPVKGWEPVDTRVRISDIPALIERLGGRALYGRNTDAPLRELLQNAADAIRARRSHESRPSNWGRICVARGRDEHGPWLEVRDNGLGMSKAVLVGPLLDFGVSYWDSDLSCEEFPGLHASGFRSAGEFGIGFFSVFMWGPKVRVTTRSCKVAQTSVLEFERGLAAPPLLREARANEHLVECGTTVRIWLAESEDAPIYGRPSDLAGRCEELCPTLDVDVCVQEQGDAEPNQVIVAGDWLTLPPHVFMQRVVGRADNLEDVLTGPSVGDDDFELDRVLAMMEPIVDLETRQVVGRACLRPPWFGTGPGGMLVSRGLRLGWSFVNAPILGALEGVPTKAARDEGQLSIRPELLQSWYEAQEAKVAAAFEGFGCFEFASILVPVMSKPVTKLPVVWGDRGWTLASLARHRELPPVIILVFPGTFEEMSTKMIRGGRREKPVADLPPHVFMLCSPWTFDLDHLNNNNLTMMALVGSIALAWQVHPSEMLSSSLLTRMAGGKHQSAIPGDEVWGAHFHVLCRPGSDRESMVAAVTEFYEFTKMHPNALPPTQARMIALGRVVGEVQKEQRERRRKK